PPERIRIIDASGDALEGRTTPIDEGSDVIVSCIAIAGNPLPIVRWFHNGKEIDSDSSLDADNVTVRNTLHLFTLSRDYFETVLFCEAEHKLYPHPVNASILIDMNLKPLYVKIEKSWRSLVAGQKAELVCRSFGSRPPAVLTWIKGEEKLLDS
ncbi:nephrin-like protein, partial [Dinothrombium tinctorium]